MIDKALKFVCEELNHYLHNRISPNRDLVILSLPRDSDSTDAITTIDKVVVSLVNVRADLPVSATSSARLNSAGAGTHASPPPLQLNLDLLVSVQFTDYPKSLQVLSAIMSFIQSRGGMFTSASSRMPEGIERLHLEVMNMQLSDFAKVREVVGGQYHPGMLYTVRSVLFDESVSKVDARTIMARESG